jgi:hypothetical protein
LWCGLKDRVYLKEGRERIEGGGGARWEEGKRSGGFWQNHHPLPPPRFRTEEGLGATGPAGVGDCRRSRAWQRPGLGAKGRGDCGGSIPTLTLGRGDVRGRLPRRRRTAGSGGWGGSGGDVVERKEGLWGSWRGEGRRGGLGGFYRWLKAVRAEKFRWWGSPAVLGRVLGARPDSRP